MTRINEITIDAAKCYIDYMEENHSGWEKAFFRFHVNENLEHGGNGSYIKDSDVFLHGSLICKEINKTLMARLHGLWDILKEQGKEFLVCLLVVDSSFNFEVYFEHNDPRKWEISNIDGNSGIPCDY